MKAPLQRKQEHRTNNHQNHDRTNTTPTHGYIDRSLKGQRMAKLIQLAKKHGETSKLAQFKAALDKSTANSPLGRLNALSQRKHAERTLQGKFRNTAPTTSSPVQRKISQEDEDTLQGKFQQNHSDTTDAPPINQEVIAQLQRNMSAARQNKANAPLHNNLQNIIQRKKTAFAANRKNNTGLPDQLKTNIENLSGYSMDDVKVHYNSSKPAQLQAHAYAQGTDIHLGPGQEKHLPHEAWHVVQQKQGRVKPTMQLKGKVNVNDDVGLEREADVMGRETTMNYWNLTKNTFKKGNDFNLSKPLQRREKGPLIGEVDYTSDSKGRPKKASGKAKGTTHNKTLKQGKNQPSIPIPGWSDLQRKGHTSGAPPADKTDYNAVRMHLFNGRLGGPGNDARNLVPGPTGTNTAMSSGIEEQAKKLVDDNKEIKLTTEVQYRTDDEPENNDHTSDNFAFIIPKKFKVTLENITENSTEPPWKSPDIELPPDYTDPDYIGLENELIGKLSENPINIIDISNILDRDNVVRWKKTGLLKKIIDEEKYDTLCKLFELPVENASNLWIGLSSNSKISAMSTDNVRNRLIDAFAGEGDEFLINNVIPFFIKNQQLEGNTYDKVLNLMNKDKYYPFLVIMPKYFNENFWDPTWKESVEFIIQKPDASSSKKDRLLFFKKWYSQEIEGDLPKFLKDLMREYSVRPATNPLMGRSWKKTLPN